MRKARILLPVIFWAVSALGAGIAIPCVQAQGQIPSQSSEKSANSGSPVGNPNASNNNESRGQADQTSKSSDENKQGPAAVKKSAPKPRPIASHAKPLQNRQQNRQLRPSNASTPNNFQTETPQIIRDSHQTSSTAAAEIPNKPVKHSSAPVPPPTVSLNGQQLKNSRDPGARMASSGGPSNSTRGTAVISGSNIKRKF
jgi:hypothetical protein